jgi:hypothetical protein
MGTKLGDRFEEEHEALATRDVGRPANERDGRQDRTKVLLLRHNGVSARHAGQLPALITIERLCHVAVCRCGGEGRR